MLSPALLLCLAAPSGLGDTEPPVARIDFPLPSALTDAASIRVRGSARDASGVAVVSVNGVRASTANGHAVWWAEVPLELGENELVVETVDVHGNAAASAAVARVRRDLVIVDRPISAIVDDTGRRFWLADYDPADGFDNDTMRILSFDPVEGLKGVASSSRVGSGPPLAPGRIRYDPHSGGALMVDRDLDAVVHIDLQNGDRTIVSGAGVGTGPVFKELIELAVDPALPRAFAVQFGNYQNKGAVFEVSLLNGKRTLVANKVLGGGDWPTAPNNLALIPGTSTAVLKFSPDFFESDLSPLYRLDLTTGGRIWLTDGPQPPLRPWQVPDALVVPDPSRLFVADKFWSQGVYGVDPVSGLMREVSAPHGPAGPVAELYDMGWDARAQRLIAVDHYRAAVLSLNPLDGTFDLLFRNVQGDGVQLSNYSLGIAVDARDPAHALILDTQFASLISVDVRTGHREWISGDGRGGGPSWSFVCDLALDRVSTPRRAFVVQQSPPRVWSVELATGERAIVSAQDKGAGVPFGIPRRIEYDPLTDSVLVNDSVNFFGGHRILRVDVRTGDRSILSDREHGIGPSLGLPGQLAVDPEGRRLWVPAASGLLAIDLDTGDRVVVSGPDVGSGPYPIGFAIAWDPERRRIVAHRSLAYSGSILAVDPETGDRSVLIEFRAQTGPSAPWFPDFALLPGDPTVEPVLVAPEFGLIGLMAVDLWRAPTETRSPGWRTIQSR